METPRTLQQAIIHFSKPEVNVNRQMKNIQEDFRAILRFCMKRWRIELQEGEDRAARAVLVRVTIKADSSPVKTIVRISP
jgi:hypothetical protein